MDTVRPLLQSVTHNLPGPIRDLGLSIIGHKCYQSLVMDINVEDVDCIKYGVSKGLGIAIIGASTIVKVPQIIKLVRSKSAEGVSFLSYLLETVAYLITLAYNYRNGFPFSTYGETALILVQNLIISTLLLRYSGQSGAAAAFLGGLSSLGMVLFSGNYIGEKNLGYLQAGAGVLGVASKLPQILTIFSEGTTGQLSAFTVSQLSAIPLQCMLTLRYRSSTTSAARCPVSLPPSRRSMTSSSSTDSSPASPSTSSSPSRWSTTGTLRRPRPRASARLPESLPPSNLPASPLPRGRLADPLPSLRPRPPARRPRRRLPAAAVKLPTSKPAMLYATHYAFFAPFEYSL